MNPTDGLVTAFVINMHTGIITFANDNFARQMQMPLQVHYTDFIKLIHDEEKASISNAFENIQNGIWNESGVVSFRLPVIEGEYEWLSLGVFYDENGETATGNIQDYTQQMNFIRLSEKAHIGELLIEGASKYIFLYDFKKDDLTFNETFIKDFNLNANDRTKNMQWVYNRLITSGHQDELNYAINKLRSGESDTIEIRLRVFDAFANTSKWIQLHGKCSRDILGEPRVLAGSITDITNQVHNEELKSLIIEGSSDCVFVFDLQKDVFEFSSKIHELIPIKSRRVQNGLETWLSFIVPSDQPIFEKAMEQITNGETDIFRAEFRLKGKDSPIWVVCSGKSTMDETGEPTLIAGSIINLETMRTLGRFVDEASSTDKNSGLPNRIAFHKDMEAIADENSSIPTEQNHFLVKIDIDNFGDINSLHGMPTGDKMLMEYGGLLSLLSPANSKLYHFTNNLFVYCIINSTQDAISHFVDRIRAYSDSGLLVDDRHVKMTVSIGVTQFCSSDKLDDIVMNAELALSRAKKVKNSVSFFDPSDKESYLQYLSLQETLRECVDENFDGFEIFYQPFYSVAHNNFAGAEALLRWRNRNGKIISPVLVIPALQQIGAFQKVETWVFKTAAKQCADWIKLMGNTNFSINVNMSPQRATSADIVDEVLGVIKQNGLEMHNMFLELTEESVASVKSGLGMLYELRDAGVKISLDDFGTGYSSLGHLRHLPICELKIDRSFITDIEENEASREFLGVLINLAHIMKYLVCIEGVETLEQARIVCNLNADFIQGYYFSKPIPKDEMQEFILTQNTQEAIYARHKVIWG
ncbi:MAG: EAL domain-containing protein [Defluviitaleaceae bacterium]|nr:EAL domain-containing protein [Defluviitaleaceae bacterium]